MKILKYFLIITALVMLNSCSDDDPCDGIVCVNGNCINGGCECDDGYTGLDCSNELEPSRIIANDIIHLFSPEFDTDANGQNIFWDIIGGNEADIYARIYLSASPNNFVDSGVLIDQTHNQRASFQFSYVFENPTELYTIELWDDETFDDFMVAGSFVPYKPNCDFPEILTIGNVGDPLQLEMNLSYEF